MADNMFFTFDMIFNIFEVDIAISILKIKKKPKHLDNEKLPRTLVLNWGRVKFIPRKI